MHLNFMFFLLGDKPLEKLKKNLLYGEAHPTKKNMKIGSAGGVPLTTINGE